MEHAIFVHIQLSDSEFGTQQEREALTALGDNLAEQLEGSKVGEFDGDEVGKGEFKLYFYGRNADRLFEKIKPELEKFNWPGYLKVVKRYGEPGARETTCELGGRSG